MTLRQVKAAPDWREPTVETGSKGLEGSLTQLDDMDEEGEFRFGRATRDLANGSWELIKDVAGYSICVAKAGMCVVRALGDVLGKMGDRYTIQDERYR